MNTIALSGNLASDPQLTYTTTGRAVANCLVIENRRRTTDGGKTYQDAAPNVWRVEIWGEQAEHLAESCGKGDRVTVVGEVITERWEDKNTGETRTAPVVRAQDVSVSLRWVTARPVKAQRSTAGQTPTDCDLSDTAEKAAAER